MSNTVSRLLRASMILAVLVAVLVAVRGGAEAGVHPPHEHAGTRACVCNVAEVSNGWCDACGVGYLASMRIPSALMFELLDPHGHEVDHSQVACPSCRSAMESDGFCEGHGVGYAEGRGYATRLAHLLAKGEPVRASADYLRLRTALRRLESCEYCALATFSNGRCPRCDIHYRDGMEMPPTTKKGSP